MYLNQRLQYKLVYIQKYNIRLKKDIPMPCGEEWLNITLKKIVGTLCL